MKRQTPKSTLPDDPVWYKDAIFYEVRVRSFYDSNGDGIGDLPGLTAKLDYLQNLGVTTLWLLPFYPSPLRDDGYDISDYTDVHPDCGTLRDFKVFLREARRRGLRVVTELVLNHTSDQHPWFQRARRAPKGSAHRDFYVWSDDPERYSEARIIFEDFENSNWTWDPVAKTYYWHRFYSHQPDLNFDSPQVRAAMFRIVDFWLGMGVDGLRLDAVPYFFEREGTSCENLPETHALLRQLRAHVDAKFKNRMLLAEANQWPEDAVAYLDQGAESHMAFHFPLMPRIFMAIRMEDRFPITDVWAQTPAIHETCQWALFLRNHDELTLEMVTEEERDYMYRAYAQEARMRVNLGIRRRLAPLMGNNRRTIELLNGILLSLPGTPVIYYGDEIGMGDNVYLGDRDGVRTPMQWSGDLNAGFSGANPQRLILPVIIDHEYHYQTVNVEAQQRNLHSLLWFMKRIIALRKQFAAFGRGTIEFVSASNPRTLAYLRAFGGERLLVVANLSRFVQFTELGLPAAKGMVPVELFGRTRFPPIGDTPYALTLGPHGFVWFSLERPGAAEAAYSVREPAARPTLDAGGSFEGLLGGQAREALERALSDYLPRCRWFRSKTRRARATRVVEAMAMAGEPDPTELALVEVEYVTGESETYVVPLGLATGERAGELRQRLGDRVIAEVRVAPPGGEARAGLLYDATEETTFSTQLYETISRRRRLKGLGGDLHGATGPAFRALAAADDGAGAPRPLKAEQTNSSTVYGDRFILKLFRALDPGPSPELEMGRMLTERAAFPHTPPLAGWLEYRARRGEPRTVAVMHGFVPNQGDAWQYTRKELELYFERCAADRKSPPAPPAGPLVGLLGDEKPDPAAADLVGAYLDAARLMGRRTAELHLALASANDDSAFAPEALTTLDQRSTYQSMRNLLAHTMRLLGACLGALEPETRRRAQRLLDSQGPMARRLETFLRRKLSVLRIRTHGDLHLGQFLYTGKDFAVIDFEGEPARPLAERRRKRPALRDVAGMLRSFDYAALGALLEHLRTGAFGERDFEAMAPRARAWQSWCSWAFLGTYLKTASGAPFVPGDRGELAALLDAFLLEKALYELAYELNNRPEWVPVALHGVEQLIAQ